MAVAGTWEFATARQTRMGAVAQMGKIFITYRHDDSAAMCDRIYRELRTAFGRDAIFKDVDSIPFGVDFEEYIKRYLNDCSLQLAVVGKDWLTITGRDGRRRLDNPGDNVRIEIETAIALDIPVVPLTVDGATLPHPDELPESLRPMLRRNGRPIRYDPDFDPDMHRLIEGVKPLLAQPTPNERAGRQPTAPVSAGPPAQVAAPPAVPAYIPRDRFRERLEQLDFVATRPAGVEVIVPPTVPVPAGPFLMGSDRARDRGAYEDEQPQHTVTLPAYRIGRCPVTVAEYDCYLRATSKPPRGEQLDHPVVHVSWHDAVAYAAWLSERTGQRWYLPSEAEWEKAARFDPAHPQTARVYPWGDTFDEHRCNTDLRNMGTTPVGTYVAGARDGRSPLGAEDMAGNVWEWTGSLYTPYHYRGDDGREDPHSTGNRVLRGGSWNYVSRYARAASRGTSVPEIVLNIYGFRLACGSPGS